MGTGTAGREAISIHQWEERSTGHIPLPGRCVAPYLCSGQGTGRCSWWHQARRSPRSHSCVPCRGRWQCGSSGPRSPPGIGTCRRAWGIIRAWEIECFGVIPPKMATQDIGKEQTGMPRDSVKQTLVPPCRTPGTEEGGSVQPHTEHTVRMLSCQDNRLRGHSAQGSRQLCSPHPRPRPPVYFQPLIGPWFPERAEAFRV